MIKLILKIVTFSLVVLLLSIVIYVLFVTYITPKKMSEYNTPEKTIDLLNDNFKNKTTVADLNLNDKNFKIKIDKNKSAYIVDEVAEKKIEIYVFDDKFYSCIEEICTSINNDLKNTTDNIINQIDNSKKYLDYSQYFFETQQNGDHSLNIGNNANLNLKNDGSQLFFDTNGVDLNIRFSEDEIEKPDNIIEF